MFWKLNILKKTWYLVVIPSAFALIIPLMVGYALPSSVQNDTNNIVTIAETEQAALSSVREYSSDLPEWTNAKVSKPITYFGVKKQPVAYEFTVLTENKKVGFIIISGLRQWTPVLEWGAGSAPSSYLSSAYTVAEERGFISSEVLTEPTIYYFGALSYYVQFNKSMNETGTMIYLPTGEIAQMPKEQPTLQMDADSAQSEWARILGGGEQKALLGSEVNLTDVPYWYQSTNWNIWCDEGNAATSYPACVGPADDYWYNYDGCSPISGAMALAYWDWHGYSNFPASDDDELIDRCHYLMQAALDGGVSEWNIGPGITATSQVYGYNFSCTYVPNPSWNNYISPIDIGRPFVFSVFPWSGGYHSVCAVGYHLSPNQVIVHPTYSGEDMRIAWGNWTWMRMDIPIPG